MAIPPEIARLPKAMQSMIKAQCGGNWARVTIDSHGAITVHNNPQTRPAKKPATKKTLPKKVAPPLPADQPPPPPPPPAPEPTPQPAPEPVTPPARPVVPVKAVAPRPVAKPVKVPPAKSPARPRKVLPGMAPQPVRVARAAPTAPPKPQRADGPKPVPVAPTTPPPPAQVVTPPAVVTPPVPTAPPVPIPPPYPPTASTPTAVTPPAPTAPKPASPPGEELKRTPSPAKKPVAPWDRRHFPRTQLRPPPPVEPKPVVALRPLPRPLAPIENLSLYAPSLTAQQLDDVVELLDHPRPAGEQLVRQEVSDYWGHKWIILPGIKDSDDWDGADLMGGALKVQKAVMKGLPDEAPLLFHDDVTALQGIDLDEVEAAVRRPQRVEIAPETGVKKYPVLKFWRGDVMTVVGFRQPALPKIIAAYIGGLGLANQGNTSNAGGAGGGGARKVQGLPKNPKQLLKRLVEAGADCTEEPGGKTHKVVFRGQDLGLVNTGPAANSKDIENSWQRMRRRMEAIRVREDAPLR